MTSACREHGNEHGIVVIGAGHAGGRAIEALRGAGYGGKLTLIGCEPFRPYERPPLSKGVLFDPLPQPQFLQADSYYAAHNVDIRLGVSAVSLDPGRRRIDLSDGRTVHYSQALIATGGRPRRLSQIETGTLPVFYLRDFDDAMRLRQALIPDRRVVIVGGGVIGLEVASAARRRQCEVTVLEAADRVMSRVASPAISAWVADRHARFGVRIHCGVSITGMRQNAIQLADGRQVIADLLVVGIGITPNVELATGAGIEVAEGILVDDFGRTSAPDVFAAGDVAAQFVPQFARRIRLETWANAQNQAAAVASNMCGPARPCRDLPWYWTDQQDFTLQVAGDPLTGVEVLRGDPADGAFTLFHLRDASIVGATAVNNRREMALARRLVQSMVEVDPAAIADRNFDLRTALH